MSARHEMTLAWSLAIATALLPATARATTFSDPGTFSTPQWSETILGAGDVVDTRTATGGNPTDFMSLATVPNGGSIVIGVYLDGNAVWDPSIQGTIDTVDMGIDVKLFSGIQVGNFKDGQAYGIGLEQGGNIFRSGFPVTGDPLDFWDPRTILNKGQTNLVLVNADGSSNNLVHPDFSAAGSPITFGFMVANSGGSPISGTTAGYDNWSLTINPVNPVSPVPEPGALALFGFGLTALALAARRRRRAAATPRGSGRRPR